MVLQQEQWWLLNNDINKSHDPTQFHNVTKLRHCFHCLTEKMCILCVKPVKNYIFWLEVFANL